jgi:hypothetical protein
MSSTESEASGRVDAGNKWLQHMPVRRLEGEAIRDSMLAVAGALDLTMFGPSVPPHISAYQDGRGKPKPGPLDGAGRRSIYIQVRRNFMTPLFLAFDFPAPISTIGARTVSTVPSQALMLMNNELVAELAERWARRVLASAGTDPAVRIQRMYLEAFGRPAEKEEITRIESFVIGQGARAETEVWADVAHVVFNTAEFVFIR